MTKIGIHTYVESPTALGSSHAWVTIEKDGVSRNFSLYPDKADRAQQNNQSQGWDGSGTHVRENVDNDRTPTVSRYKEISPEQEKKFYESISNNETYSRTRNNCATFAEKTWGNTTGEKLNINQKMQDPNGQYHDIPSPPVLEGSIRSANLEQSQSQSQSQPKSQTPPDQSPVEKPKNPYSFDRTDQQQNQRTTTETTNPYSHAKPGDGTKTR